MSRTFRRTDSKGVAKLFKTLEIFHHLAYSRYTQEAKQFCPTEIIVKKNLEQYTSRFLSDSGTEIPVKGAPKTWRKIFVRQTRRQHNLVLRVETRNIVNGENAYDVLPDPSFDDRSRHQANYSFL